MIAVVWDFDKTLSPEYMQAPLFRRFGVGQEDFFRESDRLEDLYQQEDGVQNVSRDLLYLNHILTYVREGHFAGLNNAMLAELGAEIKLYPGLPEFFQSLKKEAAEIEVTAKCGIAVEHYIVSTGLRAMIMGSSIATHVTGVWGCEFSESIGLPKYLEDKDRIDRGNASRVIRGIAYAIDRTSKTRALFEINKGSNYYKEIDVHGNIAPEDRRVPFANMIYIGDGPSDIPAFSIVNQYKGKTFAVYNPNSQKQFDQCVKLLQDNRVKNFGPADYREGTHTALCLRNAVRDIALRIEKEHHTLRRERVSGSPEHILETIPSERVEPTEPEANILEYSRPIEASQEPHPLANGDQSARSTRFLHVCKLYLKKEYDRNAPVLVKWHEENLGGVSDSEYNTMVAELERSVGGPRDPLQRRAAGIENDDVTKLVLFLDRLILKYRKH
jgi:hypothetical protein